jgi:hypothetical protein
MHILGKDGQLMSSEKITIDGKEIPVFQVRSTTIIKNKKTGVIYKDEAEWKGLGIDPKDVQVDVKIQAPSLDLLAKTK